MTPALRTHPAKSFLDLVCKLKAQVPGAGSGVLEPTVPRRQLEMFRSVNKVVALTAREGLDDVAEVTAHHDQSSVNRRNGISGQRLWPWKSPLPRPQFPPMQNDPVGYGYWF